MGKFCNTELWLDSGRLTPYVLGLEGPGPPYRQGRERKTRLLYLDLLSQAFSKHFKVCNSKIQKVNIVYGNLKSENSQDYAQKPQRNFTFGFSTALRKAPVNTESLHLSCNNIKWEIGWGGGGAKGPQSN